MGKAVGSDFITIVSGLPRSGTSMMMRVLQAGGIPALTDGIRAADADNPLGYFEYEPAKRLRSNAAWLPGARGKAVKLVYRLLYDLPSGYDYRVVFMRRNLDEVIASQNRMLERMGQTIDGPSDAELRRLYAHQLSRCEDWLRAQPNLQVRTLEYGATLKAPAEQFQTLEAFLGPGLELAAMAACVDPALHHQRRR